MLSITIYLIILSIINGSTQAAAINPALVPQNGASPDQCGSARSQHAVHGTPTTRTNNNDAWTQQLATYQPHASLPHEVLTPPGTTSSNTLLPGYNQQADTILLPGSCQQAVKHWYYPQNRHQSQAGRYTTNTLQLTHPNLICPACHAATNLDCSQVIIPAIPTVVSQGQSGQDTTAPALANRSTLSRGVLPQTPLARPTLPAYQLILVCKARGTFPSSLAATPLHAAVTLKHAWERMVAGPLTPTAMPSKPMSHIKDPWDRVQEPTQQGQPRADPAIDLAATSAVSKEAQLTTAAKTAQHKAVTALNDLLAAAATAKFVLDQEHLEAYISEVLHPLRDTYYQSQEQTATAQQQLKAHQQTVAAQQQEGASTPLKQTVPVLGTSTKHPDDAIQQTVSSLKRARHADGSTSAETEGINPFSNMEPVSLSTPENVYDLPPPKRYTNDHHLCCTYPTHHAIPIGQITMMHPTSLFTQKPNELHNPDIHDLITMPDLITTEKQATAMFPTQSMHIFFSSTPIEYMHPLPHHPQNTTTPAMHTHIICISTNCTTKRSPRRSLRIPGVISKIPPASAGAILPPIPPAHPTGYLVTHSHPMIQQNTTKSAHHIPPHLPTTKLGEHYINITTATRQSRDNDYSHYPPLCPHATMDPTGQLGNSPLPQARLQAGPPWLRTQPGSPYHSPMQGQPQPARAMNELHLSQSNPLSYPCLTQTDWNTRGHTLPPSHIWNRGLAATVMLYALITLCVKLNTFIPCAASNDDQPTEKRQSPCPRSGKPRIKRYIYAIQHNKSTPPHWRRAIRIQLQNHRQRTPAILTQPLLEAIEHRKEPIKGRYKQTVIYIMRHTRPQKQGPTLTWQAKPPPRPATLNTGRPQTQRNASPNEQRITHAPRTPTKSHSPHTQPRQAGGGTRSSPGAQQCFTHAGMRGEAQQKAYCGIHALNAILGQHAITGAQMTAYLKARFPQHHRNTNPTDYHYDNNGNFSLEAINSFLYERCPTQVTFISLPHTYPHPADPTTNSGRTWTFNYTQWNKDYIMSQCPTNTTAFLVNYPGHWTAVIQSPVDQHWYHIDSLKYRTDELFNKLNDESWPQGTYNAMVPENGYTLGQTIIHPPSAEKQTLPADLTSLHSVNTFLLHTETEPCRTIPQRTHRPRQRQRPNPTPPLDSRTNPNPNPEVISLLNDHPSSEDKPTPSVPEVILSPQKTEHLQTDPQNLATEFLPALPRKKQKSQGLQPQATPAHPNQATSKVPRDSPAPTRRGQYKPPANNKKITDFFTKSSQQYTKPSHSPTQEEGKDANPPSLIQSMTPPKTYVDGKTTPTPITQHTHGGPCFTACTMNIQGLRTAQLMLQKLQDTQSPDILALTETKLSPKQNKAHWVKNLLPSYRAISSALPGVNPSRAGVILAIKREFFAFGTLITHETPNHLQGHVAHITTTRPQSPDMEILGVYCPPTTPGAIQIRQQVYQYITDLRAKYPQNAMLVMGDFNAALYPADRSCSGPKPEDKAHHTFTQETGLQAIPEPQPRQKTWRKHNGATDTSRIDDILCHPLPRGAQIKTISTTGENTDHNILMASIPYTSMDLFPPPPELTQEKEKIQAITKLATPISKEDRHKLTTQATQELGPQINSILTATNTIMEQDVIPHWNHVSTLDGRHPTPLHSLQGQEPRLIIQKLADEITLIAQQTQTIALRVCKTKQTMNTKRTLLRRKELALYKKLTNTRHAIKCLYSQPNPLSIQIVQNYLTWRATSRPTYQTKWEQKAYQTMPAPTEEAALTTKEGLKHIERDIRKRIHALTTHTELQRRQREKFNIQKLLQTRPRMGHSVITGKLHRSTKMDLRAVNTPNGISTDPYKIKTHIQEFYTNKTSPPGIRKTGKYLPKEREIDPYPFNPATSSTPDVMRLATRATETTARPGLHTAISDPTAFRDVINSLSLGKAPGPDRIPNDILRALPYEALKALHNLIQIMWATGITPHSWKHSTTILLYKNKGTPMDLTFYRRIGLESTLYKTWTSMVCKTMAHHAETQGILSGSQGGFRAKRSTHHQLETLVSLLEDAKLNHQNLYILQADLSEAFDTPDHDKMLCIMYDLGFPTDSIEVVKDLYTGAQTEIHTPFGPTDPIPINIGTIQGDSLSPLLFTIYLEPLLRWLQVGARGYYPRIYGPKTKASTDTPSSFFSNNTFADDITILTGAPSDMIIQVDKLDRYAKWGNLRVNASKTSGTGILHAQLPNTPTCHSTIRRQMDPIRIAGEPITITPPASPFKLLGVWFTMDLNWKYQLQETLKSARTKVYNLTRSLASTTQKLLVLKTCIRPAITYAFPVMPYTPEDINLLDTILTQAAKKIYRLSPGTSTAFAREDIHNGGLGITSLAVEYNTRAVQSLTRALNDETKLGDLTRGLLKTQLHALSRSDRTWFPKYAFRVKQALIIKQAGLAIKTSQNQQYHVPDLPWIPQPMDNTGTTPTQYPLLRAPKSVRLLWSVGMNHIKELLTPCGQSMISSDDLSRKYGAGIKPKHKRALNVLTTLLHTSPSDQGPGIKESFKAKPPADRTIHQAYHEWARDTITSEDHKAPQVPITMLFEQAKRQPPIPEEGRLSLDIGQKKRKITAASSRLVIYPEGHKTQPNPSPQTETPTTTRWERAYQQIQRLPKGLTARSNANRREKMLNIYNNLSTRDDVIQEVTAYRITKSPTGEGDPQHQYLVKWEPTTAQHWEIQLLTTHGMPYKIQHMTMVDNHNLAERHTCEYCEEKSNPSGEDLHLCTRCHRAYHSACTPQQEEHSWISSEETPNWECPDCHKYLTARKRRCNIPEQQYQDDTKCHLVQYEPSWEPEELVLQHPHLTHQATALKTKCHQPRPPKRRLDADQPDIIRQGLCPHDEGRYNTTIGSATRKQLVLHPHPIHPHKDIHPTGSYTIQLEKDPQTPMAIIYGPEGQYINQLSQKVLETLWARYHRTQNTNQAIQPTTFPQDVAKLITRYQTGSFNKEGPEIHTDGQQSLPQEVIDALTTHFPGIKDRLASPLTTHPGIDIYWSAHPHDALFGAHHDAYSVKWTGCSLAHPEHSPEATTQAIKWALRSAQATPQPTLTIVLAYQPAPKKGTKKPPPTPYYQRWVDTYPTQCKVAATLEAGNEKCLVPNTWDLAHPTASKSKETCTILIIANEAGYQQYTQWTTIHKCFNGSIQPEATHHITIPNHQGIDAPNDTLYQPHKKIRDFPTDHVPTPARPTQEQARKAIEATYPNRFPLRWNWQQFAYTDGSIIPDTKKGPGNGAAVYLPPGSAPGVITDTHIPIIPGEGPDTTINQAELAAIWVALDKGATHIATDSQGSIYQIQKMLNRPHDMKEHRHNNLIRRIVEVIKNSPTPITLYKVRAHTGIHGNEMADQIAKNVAIGITQEDLITDVPASNERHNQIWIYQTQKPTPKDPNPPPRPLPTLDGHLRSIFHQQDRLGMADTRTCYYASWQTAATQMIPEESNKFMTHPDIKPSERRTAIQYRCGQLYNNKLGQRWGHVLTSNCPLCGNMDGGHHIASGCKKLHKMYTARHHQAGRTILKAILHGERAAEVAYTDVGSTANMDKDRVPAINKRQDIRLSNTSSRPDIIMISRHHNTDKVQTMTLVEIKFCRDSDPEPQLDRATKQHQLLKEQMQRTHQCKVKILPILIGVTGAIYRTDTADALKQLGIKGSLLKRTMSTLHQQAIHSLRDIVSTRRRLERTQQSARGKEDQPARRREPLGDTLSRPAVRTRDYG